jgi:predicted nucleic acid-binding protein
VTTAQRWLVDKSALRLGVPAVADVLAPRIAAGRVSVCLVTQLEVVYSARNRADLERIERDVLGPLILLITPVAAEARAREVQAALVARGLHRAVAIPDLLVAAIAAVEGLTVLHYDQDFELLAELTGQTVEWVVPRGSL